MLALGLRSKAIACVLLAVVLSVVAVTLLYFRLFDDHIRRANIATASFTVHRVQEAIEAAMNLGLALDELPGIDAILERALEPAEKIQSIVIHNDQGTIVFATNSAEVGEAVPAGALPPPGTQSHMIRVLEDSDTITVATSLSTSFGTLAGGVAARLPLAVVTNPVEVFGLHLMGAALLVVAATALLVVVGVWFLSLGPRALLAGLSARLSWLADEAVGVKPDVGRAASFPGLAAFERTTETRLERLRRGLAEVRRLDGAA